jgi:hypothetical protein
MPSIGRGARRVHGLVETVAGMAHGREEVLAVEWLVHWVTWVHGEDFVSTG